MKRRPDRVVAMLPHASPSASAKVQLALRLRQDASLTGRCACGATAATSEINADGTLTPVDVLKPGRAYYATFDHENDCPAVCPELGAALARGEIDDPASDLLQRLLGDTPT